MKFLISTFVFISISVNVLAYDRSNDSCLAIANRSETSEIALNVYFKCFESKLSAKAIEQCAYKSAGMKYSGDYLLNDLGRINSTSFLICISQ